MLWIHSCRERSRREECLALMKLGCFFHLFVLVIMINAAFAWTKRRSLRSLSMNFLHKGNEKLLYSSIRSPIQGDTIKLVNGMEGTLITIGRGGWYSVQLANKEIIKVRKSEIRHDQSSGMTNAQSAPVRHMLDNSQSIVNCESIIDQFPPLVHIQHPPRHGNYKSWIVFSDLHVKANSIGTCEQVLTEVHDQALKRNAGIIFLGDFWHVRGALSVDLLNRVLKSLQKWTQPVIMIPGNHDQVTLGGKIHSLEPLKYAFASENILMIDEPGICLNALWLPYRRNHNHMKHLLNEAWNNSDISAIFCHADVKGAWMNDGMQSREGIDVQWFPPNIPIFSGHFHKPHSVAFSMQSLRYVGSPYQTSLSEADQVKYLYEVSLLDSGDNSHRKLWRETARWPIQIGKRYFKTNFDQAHSKLHEFQPGDTVVLQSELQHQRDADDLARQLQAKGIEVEVRETQKSKLFIKSLVGDISAMNADMTETVDVQSLASNITPTGNIEGEANTVIAQDGYQAFSTELDDMAPIALFQKYMEHVELGQFQSNSSKNSNLTTNEQIAMDMKLKVIEEGKQILERLMHQRKANSEHSGGGAETMATLAADHRHLVLDSVVLRNFGPYGGAPVYYPLSQRGLVLLRGEAMDKTGADSNGSGKTTLAMSILWALTGSMDSRLTNEGRSFDVAFDALPPTSVTTASSKRSPSSSSPRRTAEVSLKGQVNGKPFEIIRRKTHKKQELHFYVGNEDMTNQAVKDTQAVMDAWLGLNRGVLQRCFFFGQHSHTAQSLLGLTDSKMKEELSPLINIDIWVASAMDTRGREKLIKTDLASVNVSLNYLSQQELPRLQEQIRNQEQIQQKLQQELQQVLQTRYTGDADESTTNLSQLQSIIQRLEADIMQLELQKSSIQSDRVHRLRKELVQLVNNHTSGTNVRNNKQSWNHRTSASPLESLQLEASRAKATLEMTSKDIHKVQTRLQRELPLLLDRLDTNISSIITGNDLTTEMETSVAIGTSLEEIVRKKLDETIGVLAGVDEQLRSINATLQRLSPTPSRGSLTQLRPSSTLPTAPDATHTTTCNDDLCPTCNQTFPMESRVSRQQTLRQELSSLLKARNQQLQAQRKLQEQLSAARQLMDLQRQQTQLRQEDHHLREQLTQLLDDQEKVQREETQIQVQLATLQQEERQAKAAFQQQMNRLQSEIDAAESDSRGIDSQLRQIKQQLQEQQRRYELQREQEGKTNVTISLLEEKMRFANQSTMNYHQQLAQMRQSIQDMETKRHALLDQATLLSYLTDFFGPKGVQHFIFQSVIQRLEYLANTYLDVLATGGIRLQLRSDPDGEKILKYVLVRHSGHGEDDAVATSDMGDNDRDNDAGEAAVGLPGFRERGLSQLSGGQWRRVSLALDFAFTELVIRRGLLKCNVLVLDEILTHLDAQGREAVGTVLKAMVDRSALNPPVNEERKNNVFGGGFETILVILQDLAANEIEEAFDHIDVVRKDGDVSKVIVDK